MAGPFMIIALVRSVYRIRDYRAFQIHRYCTATVPSSTNFTFSAFDLVTGP